MSLIDLRLDQFFGGANGDKAADHIQLEATDATTMRSPEEDIGAPTAVTVDGMAAKLVLRATEAAFDSLDVDTLEGDDRVDSSGLEPGVIELLGELESIPMACAAAAASRRERTPSFPSTAAT